jgi:MFS family permease
MSCILMPVGSRISGRIKNVPDLRKIMLRGSIALSVGYVIIAALSQGPFLLMLATLSIAGFCAGLLFSGDTIAILNILEPAKASSGLATLSLVRQIGAVFGIALIGSASELFGRATSIDNGKSLAIALAGVATLSCYFLLKKALTATVHD